ncbi:MAG TPA: hypothetical protein VFE84_02285 [Patescibacteria group bacterium]|nr:hypothetical protein [Patescibacteria group bacterium]
MVRIPALALGLLACLAFRPAFGAGDRVLFQGLADAEAWDTGTQSYYLTRNDGETATQRRLRLWTAAQITSNLQGFLLGRIEGGDANSYLAGEGTVTNLDQAWLRYAFTSKPRFVLQAGKMAGPIGSFNRRYLSSQNPLIGNPATYDLTYPYAVQLTGSAGRADFTIAVMDQPVARQIYLPEPDSSARPALSAGITPFTGFRIGAYATRGPYLARQVEPFLPAGRGWRDYEQNVVGLDLQFSRGHFELNCEATKSLFEVPGQHDDSGIVYYIEPKYTWSPRWFTALRIERNQNTSVWLPYMAGWYVTDEDAWDVEAGVGFRIDPHTLMKASYRVDRSAEDPAEPHLVDRAIALQLSYGFDVRALFDRPR